MLVNCPECDAEISSSANKCPNCGLPNAGGRSEEVIDSIIKKIKEDPMGFLVRRQSGDYYGRKVHCEYNYHNPRFFSSKEHKMALKSYSFGEHGEYGHCVSILLYCQDCGRTQNWPCVMFSY